MANTPQLANAFTTTTALTEKPLATRLQDVLDGPYADARNQARAFISRPELAPVPADMPKDEYRALTLERIRMMIAAGYTRMPFKKESGGGGAASAYINMGEVIAHADMSLAIKQGVQFGLFGTSIERLGTEKHWHLIKDVISGKLLGGFGMTEMACGSDVRGSQTVAIYDHATRSFTINTPNESARKTYIGNAARHGRLMVVFAQLKLTPDGETQGVHAFLVPVRDEDGKVKDGVTIGDNGHKVGLNGVDNGTLSFGNVKVPYDALLDKFGGVDETGNYVSSVPNQTARFYKTLGALVTGRVFVSMASLSGGKNALAAAVKFAEPRKVFGEGLMDKQATQTRVIPRIAEAYALHFATRHLLEAFEQGDENIETMANALKSISSDWAMQTIDEGRTLSGGLGYMSSERYGVWRNDVDIFRTFEGDNTVLRLAVAQGNLRHLVKKFDGHPLGDFVKSLAMSRKGALARWKEERKDEQRKELMDIENKLAIMVGRERQMAYNLVKKFRTLKKAYDKDVAGNLVQDDMVAYGDAYAERLILEQFINAVGTQKDPEVKVLLQDLCSLYAVHTIRRHADWYLENEHLSPEATHMMKRLEHDLNAKLRPQAQTLVDAFGIPAHLLSGHQPVPRAQVAAPAVG